MTAIFFTLVLWSWHASLLVGCAWLLCRLNRSRSASVRHRIWLFALFSVALLPFWTAIAGQMQIGQLKSTANFSVFVNLPESIVKPSDNAATFPIIVSEIKTADFSLPSSTPDFDWLFWISTVLFVIWICGVSITAGKFFLESRRVWHIRLNSRQASFAELDCLPHDSTEIGSLSFAFSNEISAPMLIGVFRPLVLLPADFHEWTTPAERLWIIKHELAHLARHDNLTVVFQSLLGIVFFFHPFVRYALRQMSIERELACDEQVIERSADSFLYAESLLKAARRSLSPSATAFAVAFTSRKTLQKRIEYIMNPKILLLSKKNRWFFALPALALIMSAFILLGCSQAARTSSDEQEIGAFLKELSQLEINGTAEDFDRIAAPEFVRIGADGEVGDKQQLLSAIRKKGTSDIQSVEMQNEQIRIYGNTAIVTGLGIARGENKTGEPFVIKNFCTFVLVKRDGHWLCVSVQQTRQD